MQSCLQLRDTIYCKGMESDGNKFEKIKFRCPILGQLQGHPDYLPIQDRGDHGENFRIGRKYLGGILN
jgi:hypothetical protein